MTPVSRTARARCSAPSGSMLRPTFFPVPKFLLSCLLGEMTKELLLAGVRVYPRKLQESGYIF
ncbi:MAG: DUF1731 domain-containing protein, partial [Candidatus Electrothrix sp. AUS1_2]|nr:DUF1731 domain-containing protein [Candidatus Electrothrix sp. AUS1_2]